MDFELPFQLKSTDFRGFIFHVFRLAIFNLDEEQSYYFKGLNTPVNTILLFGMYYAFQETGMFWRTFENPVFLVGLIAASCLVTYQSIKMIALKFKSMKLKDKLPKTYLTFGKNSTNFYFRIGRNPMVIVFLYNRFPNFSKTNVRTSRRLVPTNKFYESKTP